jgi:type I restriction enzyme S subunit
VGGLMSRLVPKLRFKEFSGEWNKKPINKILTIGSGKDYKHLSSGDIPVYGTGGYMLSVNDYLYDRESVCIGRKGTIDKPMLLTGKFWTVDTLFYTHSFKNNIPKFIYALFLKINWYKYNEASGVPSLSKVTIGKIDIFIPPPKEQQKIASCLSSLDALIEAQNKKVSVLKQHKKGLMQQLFPAEGKREPKLRFKAFSGEWVEKKLGDVSNINMGQSPASSSYNNTNNGIYLIQGNADIKDRFSNPRQWTTEPTKLCDIGDLILTVRAPVGYIAKSLHKTCIGRGVCSLSKKENNNIEFIYQFLLSYEKNWVSLEQGSTFTAVSGNDIKSLKINTPIPKEQQKIASCLSSLDALIEAQNKKVSALKQHKKALMQQMFVSNEVGA